MVWLEAAGECEGCHAIPEVMVTFADAKNNAVDVQFRLKHGPGCYENEYVEEISTEEDFGAWEVSKDLVHLGLLQGRKSFQGFSRCTNVTPCSSCEKLLYGIPLILWSNDKNTEYRFCFPCAGKEGILNYFQAETDP
jgi:hypothetical protein